MDIVFHLINIVIKNISNSFKVAWIADIHYLNKCQLLLTNCIIFVKYSLRYKEKEVYDIA